MFSPRRNKQFVICAVPSCLVSELLNASLPGLKTRAFFGFVTVVPIICSPERANIA